MTLGDRRRHARRPKLLAFMLQWRRAEEKVFTTDVSSGGLFLRTAIAPPLGTQLSLLLPEARPADERLELTARVVRQVRRGDPFNPLGGIGVELLYVRSPRGTRPVEELLGLLLSGHALRLEPHDGPVVVRLPDCHVILGVRDDDVGDVEEYSFTDAPHEHTRPVSVELAVFCRWRNMIIQSVLSRLGSEQAILTRMRVLPEIGDEVTVRILAVSDMARFCGLEFRGTVDQVRESDGQTFVSLALNPLAQQPEVGGLRAFLRRLDEPEPDEG